MPAPGPPSNPPHVLMLVLNDMTHDSRVRREADALADAGFRVVVIGTHDASSPLPDREAIRGWELRRFRYGRGSERLRHFRVPGPLRHIWQLIALVRALKKHHPQAWHAHDFPALVPVALARLGRRAPNALVYDVHDLYFHRSTTSVTPWHALARRTGLWLERRLARRADARLTVSPLMADFLAALWDISPPPTVVLNGAAYPPDAPALARPTGARLWLVHTGTLIARGRKLPEVLAGLVRLPPDVHLTCLGDGPQQVELVRLAAALGLAARVHFLPPVPPEHVSAAIRHADAAVVAFDASLPNYAVTIPNKLFEALGAGLPVVAARTPALERFFAAHPIGPLWDAADPASLAEAVAALADPAQSSAWRQAARTAQAQAGWRAQARILCDCYQTFMPLEQTHAS
ncbi:MAG: glycosyltransferase [Anaerolineae bacterium]|nr:glycosyltransferase [Anaerolineae bacterium]